MDFEYRTARPEEREAYVDFANFVFSQAHRPHDFEVLIPRVYGRNVDSSSFHRIAVDEKGRIRGCVAVLPGVMKAGDTGLKTGFVGTVSVHPYARGEGHMKRLMHDQIEAMRSNGTDLAMLGGQRQRYEYFGFTKGIIAWEYFVTSANVRHALKDCDPEGITLRIVTDEDSELLDRILRLHENKPVREERPREGLAAALRTWTATPYAVLEEGEFRGYLILSEDRGSVTELVLSDYALTGRVVKRLFTDLGIRRINITASPLCKGLNACLASFAEDAHPSDTEMLRIFRFGRVIGAFLKLRAQTERIEDASREFLIDGEPVGITVQNGLVTVTDHVGPEAVRLTGQEAQRMFFSLSGSLTAQPLPFGWDRLPIWIDSADNF